MNTSNTATRPPIPLKSPCAASHGAYTDRLTLATVSRPILS